MIDRTVVIIPTYNERGTIELLITKIKQSYPGLRLYVVDDNSTDGTTAVLQNLAKKYADLRLIWRERPLGLASAYLDAFARIIPDDSIEYIITMDGDLSHDPADIAKLITNAAAHDLVIGSRYVEGGKIENWAWWRKFISKYGNIYTRAVMVVPIRDLTAGFVLYKRELLFKILPHIKEQHPYAYQTEMKYLAHLTGAKIKEVPITFFERAAGTPKFKKTAIWEALFFPWQLRFSKKPR